VGADSMIIRMTNDMLGIRGC